MSVAATGIVIGAIGALTMITATTACIDKGIVATGVGIIGVMTDGTKMTIEAATLVPLPFLVNLPVNFREAFHGGWEYRFNG